MTGTACAASLKTFGYVLPKKLRATYIASVREIIEGNATLEPILMPMLRTLAATMERNRALSDNFVLAFCVTIRERGSLPAPPARSRRALLTHRAPPSGSGVEAVEWQRV
jgi:hypothetical protein